MNIKLSDNIEINLLRHGAVIFRIESHFKLYIHYFPALSRSRDTVDAVATGSSVVQIPAGKKDFSVLQNHLYRLYDTPSRKAAAG